MDIVIIGAGGHGRVVLDILQCSGAHNPIGFIDADPALAGALIDGVPVLGQANVLPRLRSASLRGAIIAIGDNRTRCSYARRLQEQDWDLVNAIHPAAVVARSAQLEVNVVVAAMANVGAAARIESSVIVNTGAIVEHECVIEAGVHLCPAAALAGRVRVGARAFVGMGSRVIQCVNIGADCIIGAGAVVLRDIDAATTVVGVPATPIRSAGLSGVTI